MLTKGAIGNLVNRYKAVLAKCNLINTFGSLAVASMLVLGGAGVASAEQAEGFAKKYEDIQQNGIKIVGGWEINENSTPPASSTDIAKTNITIKNVDITDGRANGHVYGGNYAKADGTYHLKTSSVIVDNSTVEMIVGGHGSYNANVIFNTDSTNLIINSGTFGSTNHETDCVELLVVGGNIIRSSQLGKDLNATSTNNSASIIINGGTFNAAIIGGSAATANHDGARRVKNITVEDISTFTKITGGTFSHPIVAGGMAYGPHTESRVTSAQLEISGPAKFSDYADIYAGGIRGEADSSGVLPKCSVGTSVVTIKDATVMNVYGTHAKINFPEKIKTSPAVYSWTYEPRKEANDAVNTKLTLTNATVTGEVYIPEGSIELRAENKGKVKIKDFQPGAGVPVTMSTDGVTNDFFNGNAQKLVDDSFVFDDKTQKDGKLRAEAGIVIGELTGDVVDGVVSNVTEKPSETNVAMADLPNINHMLTRVEMNDLRKRMGDIRLLEGETGTWARWEGGRLKGDNGLTNDFHKIQLGVDTTTGIESLRLGASFSYTNGDMDFAKASAESDTLSFAGYGVWTADNGMFADVIARLAFIDTEIQTDKVKGELDNLAFSLSGEYGWRFNLCDQFFVEPQVELTYTYIDSDDFTSAGAKFDFDSSDSLIGRAGLAAGWKLPDDRGDLYARASVVQEFMGDGKLTASMGNTLRRYETDGDDTWFEYGLGANIKLNKNVYVFGDVERTEGAEIDEEWRGTVGLRYSF